MANILILGAGSMGTAFSFPCSDNNHSVSIVGTKEFSGFGKSKQEAEQDGAKKLLMKENIK